MLTAGQVSVLKASPGGATHKPVPALRASNRLETSCSGGARHRLGLLRHSVAGNSATSKSVSEAAPSASEACPLAFLANASGYHGGFAAALVSKRLAYASAHENLRDSDR